MFEDRNNMDSDLLIRSILEGGQEEVPAHVWEGVSSGLDALDRKKRIALWWRRSIIGTVSAAAAAVAAVLLVNPTENDTNLVPQVTDSNLIAVVSEPETSENSVEEILIAQAVEPSAKYIAMAVDEDVAMGDEDVAIAEDDMAAVVEDDLAAVVETNIKDSPKFTAEGKENIIIEDWEEDEQDVKKIRTSVVLSGLTGTNNPQNNGGKGLMKRPSIANEPLKTGVKETSTQSTYGVPISFGVGLKFELTPKWAISAGLNYSMLSRTFYGTYTEVENSTIKTSVSSDIKNIQHYIGIPVNAYYNITKSKNINFYTYAGGTVEKCISNKYDVLSTSIVHSNNPAGVQLSVNAGLGVEFMIGQYLGIYLDPSLKYYFNNNQPKSIRTAQPLMLGFEMGLRVQL